MRIHPINYCVTRERRGIKMSNKEIVYIAELDNDVDDVIAAEYLYNAGVLKCVVCDPRPSTKDGKMREQMLKDIGIEVLYKMPPIAKYVFVGGALTLVSQYVKTHRIEYLIMNGGFAGTNVVSTENELDKFKGKTYIRTFNFNCNVNAADCVLRSTTRNIGHIVLVGKNVCHSKKNTEDFLWNDTISKALFRKYHVKPGKRQHDMLACHEGLCILNQNSLIDINMSNPYCSFEPLYPCIESGLQGNMTKWGSTRQKEKTPYRECFVAVGYR